jgi:hypothetical protein
MCYSEASQTSTIPLPSAVKPPRANHFLSLASAFAFSRLGFLTTWRFSRETGPPSSVTSCRWETVPSNDDTAIVEADVNVLLRFSMRVTDGTILLTRPLPDHPRRSAPERYRLPNHPICEPFSFRTWPACLSVRLVQPRPDHPQCRLLICLLETSQSRAQMAERMTHRPQRSQGPMAHLMHSSTSDEIEGGDRVHDCFDSTDPWLWSK